MTLTDLLALELRALGWVALWALAALTMLAAHTLSAYGGTWRPR